MSTDSLRNDSMRSNARMAGSEHEAQPSDEGIGLMPESPKLYERAVRHSRLTDFVLRINLQRVLLNHAVAIKFRNECGDGALHHLDPAARKVAPVALVVERHDLFL